MSAFGRVNRMQTRKRLGDLVDMSMNRKRLRALI